MILAKNFTLEELTGTEHKEFLADNIYYAMNNFEKLKELATFAQKIRDLLNSPMTITRAVRSPNLNVKLGGSSTSQHQKVEALDFITKKMDLNEAFNIIKNSGIKFGQLIKKENSKGSKWIHISIGTKRETLEYKKSKYIRV